MAAHSMAWLKLTSVLFMTSNGPKSGHSTGHSGQCFVSTCLIFQHLLRVQVHIVPLP